MNNWEEQFNKTYDWLIAEYQGDCEDIKAFIHKVEKEAYERGKKEGREEIISKNANYTVNHVSGVGYFVTIAFECDKETADKFIELTNTTNKEGCTPGMCPFHPEAGAWGGSDEMWEMLRAEHEKHKNKEE